MGNTLTRPNLTRPGLTGNNLTQQTLERPGPCIAILEYDSSNLRLVWLNGESTRAVKISGYRSYGIVIVNGQVYVVDEENILEINNDGNTTSLIQLNCFLRLLTKVISFQNKIYILRPGQWSMVLFDPADKTSDEDLPGCQMYGGFCCCASDKFIYAMGGLGTDTSARKYDPSMNVWIDIAPMTHERSGSVAAAVRNQIYVLGGLDNPPPEFYDEQNSTWCGISKMNVPRYWFSACVINNHLYAIGGDRDEEGKRIKEQSIEIYDGNQWKIVTKFEVEIESLIYACAMPHASDQPDGQRNCDVLVDQVTTGNTESTAEGGNSLEVNCDVLGQILVKEGEVLVLCYSQQSSEIARMIAHLTEDKLFKMVNPKPIPVCNYTEDAIKLQLKVHPPNERNVAIEPCCHHVDVEGVLIGPPVSFDFACKVITTEVNIAIELHVTKGKDIEYKYPFELIRHAGEETGNSAQSLSTNGQLQTANRVFNVTGSIRRKPALRRKLRSLTQESID